MPLSKSAALFHRALLANLLVGLLVLALPGLAQPTPSPANAEGDAATVGPQADVRLALHATYDGGPTEPRGWAGGRLSVGGSVTAVVGAGRFLMPGASEPRCTSFANSMPFEALPHDLTEASVVWELKATLETLDQDAMTLAMEWRRMQITASGVAERTRGGEATVVLHHGKHRVLDYAAFDDPELACYSAGVLARVEARYLGYRAQAHLPVRHRLWLIQEIDGQEVLSKPLDLVGLQGEELGFQFGGRPMDLALTTTEGEPVNMVGRVTGSITAWWRDGAVQLTVLDTRAEHRMVIPGADAGHFSSGSGAKRFESRPGEVIDIEIPVPHVSLTMMGEGLEPSGSLPDGLSLAEGLLRIDGRTLLAHRRTALRLEVLSADAED